MKLHEWNTHIAAVISVIGTPQFPEELVRALRARVAFDYSVMFAYRGDAPPIDLFDDFPANKRRIFVTMYQEGPYLLDPFFLACARGIDPGLYRLREFAPDRFYQSEYFRSYYVQTGLAEEIGYFVDLPGGVTAVVSLMRADPSATFSAREFRELRDLEPVVRAVSKQQWCNLHRQFEKTPSVEEPPSSRRYIDHAFRTFGRNVLTPRERDVVEYVLKGYSSEAIGKMLSISPGTVRIHRKNIYAKLGINSQGALFSHFIKALG